MDSGLAANASPGMTTEDRSSLRGATATKHPALSARGRFWIASPLRGGERSTLWLVATFPFATQKQQTRLRILAARFARALLHLFTLFSKRGRREDRAPAGTHDGPRAEHCTRNAQERHRAAETPRPSLRSGFTAYAALSPTTNSFLSPTPRELTMQLARLSQLAPPQGLTVATTARTTRFCRTRDFSAFAEASAGQAA